jgi:hypothetical protein
VQKLVSEWIDCCTAIEREMFMIIISPMCLTKKDLACLRLWASLKEHLLSFGYFG